MTSEWGNMDVGSLFSGIGGIELGFEREGFEIKWCVESDLHAQTILKKRFSKADIYGDIKKVDFKAIRKVQVLIGGFPCQDISIANPKGDGIKGSRSSLWKYYLWAISQIRPRFALIENVSNIINRGFEVVIADLASIGYDAEWHCIPAAAVGANHIRERMFILAYPNKRRLQGIQQEYAKREFSFMSQVSEEVSQTWNDELSEPPLLGVGNGVPQRVDRTKRIGNAVVPQIAEVFARAIKEVLKNEEMFW